MQKHKACAHPGLPPMVLEPEAPPRSPSFLREAGDGSQAPSSQILFPTMAEADRPHFWLPFRHQLTCTRLRMTPFSRFQLMELWMASPGTRWQQASDAEVFTTSHLQH